MGTIGAGNCAASPGKESVNHPIDANEDRPDLTNGQLALGSAEPLTNEQRAARLRELAAYGIDLSLIWAGLDKSPTQRFENWAAFQSFVDDLQAAMRERQGLMPASHDES